MGKYALLVGINQYADPKNNLAGCINDIINMRIELLKRGFNADDIRVVTDSRATQRGIVMRLNWLVRARNPGDVLFFHYSGHGSQLRDRSGDELSDSLDEMICPHDLSWERPFSDDKINDIIGQKNPDSRLTMFFDCCHSATQSRSKSSIQATPRRIIPPIDIQLRADSGKRDLPRNNLVSVVASGNAFHNVLSIAACQDDQTAADALIQGMPQGAMTATFLQTLNASPEKPVGELISDVTKNLTQARFSQKPAVNGHLSMIQAPFLS